MSTTGDRFIRNNFPAPYLDPGGDPSEEEQKNIDIIVRVMKEFWLEGRTDVAKELFAEGGLRHDPVIPDIVGPEGYSELVEKYHDSFKFTDFDLQIVMAERDWVAWRTMTTAVHTGYFFGIPATGVHFPVLTHTFVKFNKEHLAMEGWVLTDYLSLVKDLFTAMTFWQKVFALPTMYKAMKEAYTVMNASGHKPVARPDHPIDLAVSADEYIRENFPAPFLEAEKPTEDERKNINVVLHVNKEFWFEGRTELADQLFVEDSLRHDPLIPDVHGVEGYKRLVKDYHKSFKFTQFDVQLVMVEGDFVAWRTVTSGLHVGDFYGIPPTGAHPTVVTHAFARFDKSHRILEAWVLTDYLSIFMDLFFAMSWWQRIVSLPRMIEAAKVHLTLLDAAMAHHEAQAKLPAGEKAAQPPQKT